MPPRGLANVFGIVEEHHGSIKVYSEVDSGATFLILLPLLTEEQSEAQPSIGVASSPVWLMSNAPFG